jgi:CoA:oxalate CoA-transferase
MTDQAVGGIKILDLSHYIAGPYCTKILAGFGANVIKIEKPQKGDPARDMGPFLNDEPGQERSGLFQYLNSGKKSITLNLKSDAGIQIFRELVQSADVVVENFSPGVMERFGLDYKNLEKINSRLVMTSLSNFGQTGPYRDYKSAHIIAWGMSGGRYVNSIPPERPVQGSGWLTEYIAGIHGVIGTTTALYQRNNSGVGDHVDVSLLESTIMSTCYPVELYSYYQQLHMSHGRPFLGIFPCKDGYIGLNIYTIQQWEMICAFFGMPGLIEDARFKTLAQVRDNVDEVRPYFYPLVINREKMELFQSGAEWRIPFGLVPTTEEIINSPQHQARNFFEEIEHPVIGKVMMPGAPFKMMGTPWQLRSPAPLLGEHNKEVYCDQLGFIKTDLVRLREQGII